ncbi:VOC family protein [Posidoniimonas corsicana]|uniref:VOC family protein n=1 Tax=Posidoniimonas corsicana TaxID=1938618 RepID=UPI0036F3B105
MHSRRVRATHQLGSNRFGKKVTTAKLNLLVIRSADMNRAQQFYEAVGLQFARHSHGSGPEHLAHESGGVVFEIYPPSDPAENTTSTRLGFAVASVDATISLLASLGAVVKRQAQDSEWGRRAVVLDFDKHVVELIETSPAQPSATA